MSSLFRRRSAAAVVCTTLVLAPASAMPALAVETAPAAGSTTIAVLGFNDFHGALSPKFSGTQFADTVEDYRAAFEAQHGAGSVLLTSAGDLIGGSASVSNVQQDDPTIDVMNALGLAANAAGNHEFDKGLDDVTGRVIPHAQFPILSANVVDPATQQPVLASHVIREVNGVRVAVIGASPNELYATTTGAGLKGAQVIDEVAAVNTIADQLKASGQADVVIASYHDGAAASDAALESQAGKREAFDHIVKDTSSSVDVIFNAHTHQLYQYTTDNQGLPRPVLQAGASGSNLAAVELTVDADRKLTGVRSEMLARSTQAPVEAAAEHPRTAAVYEIEQRAVAVFQEKQGTVVGPISAPITTDYAKLLEAGKTWKAGGTRSAETTLGNWVADAIKGSVASANPEVDLGVTNPGGLRSELLPNALTDGGAFTAKPAELQGRLTLGELLDMAPFNNSITYFEIPGSSIKKALEQNWRDDVRKFTLGWSQNLTWTYDESRPQGDKVTGVWIDGKPLDEDAYYTVATQSFLADNAWVALGDPTKAPDGYTAFAEGRRHFVNLGVIDSTAIAEQARRQAAADGSIHPAFAKKGVPVSGAPASVNAGEDVVLTLGDLVIDSDGAPAATSVDVAFAKDGGAPVQLGTVAVPAGSETVTLAGIKAPAEGGEGELVMTVRYADGTTTVVRHALTVVAAAAPAEPTAPATPAPSTSAPATPAPSGSAQPTTPATPAPAASAPATPAPSGSAQPTTPVSPAPATPATPSTSAPTSAAPASSAPTTSAQPSASAPATTTAPAATAPAASSPAGDHAVPGRVQTGDAALPWLAGLAGLTAVAAAVLMRGRRALGLASESEQTTAGR